MCGLVPNDVSITWVENNVSYGPDVTFDPFAEPHQKISTITDLANESALQRGGVSIQRYSYFHVFMAFISHINKSNLLHPHLVEVDPFPSFHCLLFCFLPGLCLLQHVEEDRHHLEFFPPEVLLGLSVWTLQSQHHMCENEAEHLDGPQSGGQF